MTDPDNAASQLRFVPTAAVLASRSSGAYIPCPVCEADSERYLFSKMGARVVRCRSCGLVYANPPLTPDWEYLDVDAVGQHTRPRDRELFRRELATIVRSAGIEFERLRGRPPRETVLTGRTLDDDAPVADTVNGLRVLRLEKEQAQQLSRAGDAGPIARELTATTDILVLNEVLEVCPQSASVMDQLTQALNDDALVVVVFSNARSFPAKVLRRHWPRFFPWRSVYFDPDTLSKLMDRVGLRLVAQERRTNPYTVSYVADRLLTRHRPQIVDRPVLGSRVVRLPLGTWVATFEKHRQAPDAEMLTVVVPVFNEATYVAPVLDALLAKQVSIPKEIVVVESNSTDGTREIVRSYEGAPGLRIVYEDEPGGKGVAVRRGLAIANGSIFLIQDADFEYDLDDYDALLEPILQRRTSFVLGSRSLGIDDWKVRRLASSRIKALLMNLAQLLFAKTFNVLYQQRTTDVNTMFKVFRRECIEGVDFRGDGFNFDIELVCRIVSKGFSPMEVPVNYAARGFDEGKKINFVTEFFPSYSMLYRCRFAPARRG